MELVQSRIVTDDVERLAAFYAALLRTRVTLNEYYVEVPAGQISVGFSKRRFTERQEIRAARARALPRRTEIILDFLVDNVDAEYDRVGRLGVQWIMPPTTQPWGNRAMICADPEGNLINVFTRAD